MADFETGLSYDNVLKLMCKPFIDVSKDVCVLDYDNNVIIISASRAIDNYLRSNVAFEEIRFFSNAEKIFKITHKKKPKRIGGNSGLC